MIKRLFDILVSFTGLLLLLPLFAGIAVFIFIKAGSPVLFHQQRPGYRGKPFNICKFRSMTDKKDENGVLLPDAQRLEKWGILLRRCSFDELPQLFNVLRGDMSLIGPRPLLMKYMELYNCEQARRHDMRPGITGLAAINGRNSLGWEKRFYYDTWYVDHWSLGLDIRIFFKTIDMVFIRKKNVVGYEISDEYKGNEEKHETDRKLR